jgi:chemotaxis protein methyltransferase CheR
VAEQLGDWTTARDSLKKALFLDKNLVLGHYYLAVMDERDGALNDALRRYRTVCRLLGQTSSNCELPFSDGVTSSRLMELAESRTSELERMV